MGGSDTADLAQCAQIAAEWGYDEVNLNCGCPSPKVQKGSFGACLMLQSDLVADCLKAMQDVCSIDITLKHRIGIDQQQEYAFVRDFIGQMVHKTQCKTYIVHARNAWLKGLSPKENREIPPLRREVVYQLKKDFPEAIIVINGALQDLGECEAELKHVDGVMLGRAAYYTPWLLTDVDARLYNDEHAPVTRDRVIDAMEEYVRFIKPDDHSLRACCRHMHGLLTGLAGAKVWRRTLSDTALIREQGADIFRYAYGKAGWADVESFPDEDREFFS